MSEKVPVPVNVNVSTEDTRVRAATAELATSVDTKKGLTNMTLFGYSLWKIVLVVVALLLVLNYTETGKTYKLKIKNLTQSESPGINTILGN